MRRCAECELEVHAACADEFGACPTTGCGGAWSEPTKPALREARRLEVDLGSEADDEPPQLSVAAAASAQRQCPFCRDELGDARRTCSACQTQVHPECAAEFGACPTAGCGGQWSGGPAAEPQAARPRRRWAKVLALLAPALFLGGLWLRDTWGPQGQERALGGWFSGHGSPVSAVLGALTKNGYDKDVGNVAVVDVAVEGDLIASAAADGQVILWSARSGSELRELHGARIAPREGQVRIAFDGPGGRLFLKCASLTAWIDVKSGEVQRLHDLGLGELLALVPASAGVRFVHREGGELLVSELAGDALRTFGALPDRGEVGLAFTRGGERLFYGLGGRLRELDLERWQEAQHPLVPTHDELSVSPSGEAVAWVGKKGACLGSPTRREVRQLEPKWGSWGFTGLAFSPDGSLLAAGRFSGGVWVWEVESGSRIAVWDGPVAAEGPAWTADGRSVLVWGRDQKVRFYRVPRSP